MDTPFSPRRNPDQSGVSPFAEPGSAEYADAVGLRDQGVKFAPEAAMVAERASQVAHGIEYARAAGKEVTVFSTGHSAAAASDMAGAFLIRTQSAAKVRVDAAKKTARVPAGATWGEVVSEAAKHGLAAVHGTAASVGVVGDLLKGSVGMYGRRYGFGANQLNSITVVTADGARTVSDEKEPRLFWALRGGGGGFGVVTQVEIALKPMHSVISVSVSWDADHAAAVGSLWLEWCRTAPREASTLFRLIDFPELPGLPAILADRQLLFIDCVVVVERVQDRPAMLRLIGDLFNPLRDIARPVTDEWAENAPDSLLAGDPGTPLTSNLVADHYLVNDLAPDDLDCLLKCVGPQSGSTLLGVELRQLSGEYAHPARSGGALDRTTAAFSFLAVGIETDDASRVAHGSYLADARSALEHRSTGFTLPTFVDTRDQRDRTLTAEASQIVAEIRDEYDPAGMFRRDALPNLESPDRG